MSRPAASGTTAVSGPNVGYGAICTITVFGENAAGQSTSFTSQFQSPQLQSPPPPVPNSPPPPPVPNSPPPPPPLPSTFGLAANGVTVVCPNAKVGDTGVVNGVTYTKRDIAGLLALAQSYSGEAQLVTSCTSGVEDMRSLFTVCVFPLCVLLPRRCVVARPLTSMSPLTPPDPSSPAVL